MAYRIPKGTMTKLRNIPAIVAGMFLFFFDQFYDGQYESDEGEYGKDQAEYENRFYSF